MHVFKQILPFTWTFINFFLKESTGTIHTTCRLGSPGSLSFLVLQPPPCLKSLLEANLKTPEAGFLNDAIESLLFKVRYKIISSVSLELTANVGSRPC